MEMSNVLILNLGMTGAKRDCKVPHTLYVDRYLEENRVAAEATFAETKKFNQRSAELDAQIEKIKWHVPQKVQYPQKMETLKLLETSMKAFESDAESPNHSNDVAVLKHLQALHNSVERKLSGTTDLQSHRSSDIPWPSMGHVLFKTIRFSIGME
jgi:ribosomal protein L9